MSIDRNRLEQEALRLLQKGQLERALERYLTLLRDKPRDLRVRQQVADLYKKVGQNQKAEQHLREIARFHKNSGKARAAIGVYKQILRLKPDDMGLYGDLGDCYQKAGFPKEALQAYNKVVDSLAKFNPDKAVPFQEKLIALQPGNLPVQVRLAELFEASNWAERAQGEWRRLAREARRHGKLDDRARFLMKSIAARDSHEIALEAAEAWVDLGDWETALPLLQKATTTHAEDPLALTLLAKTLTGLGAKDKAQQVWLLVARLHLAAGRAVERAEALRAALEAGAEDPALESEIAQANLQAERTALRLTSRGWAAPGDDAAGDLVVRAAVYSQYGFPEKALETLQSSPDVGGVLAVQASMVETHVACGDTESALAVLAAIEGPDEDAQADLRVRMLVLEGRPEAIDDSDDLDEDELVDDDELLDDDLLDDELLDDEADGDDDTDGGAPSPPDEPDDELLDDELLDDESDGEEEVSSDAPTAVPDASDDGLSSLFGGGFDSEEPPKASADDDGLASLFATSLAEPASGSAAGSAAAPFSSAPQGLGLGGPLGDAEALLQVCAFDEAEAIAAGGASLGHALILARVRRGRGDVAGALTGLRDALDDAPEDDPAYVPALLEMAELNVGRGKRRAARRLLDEVEDLDSLHSPARVSLVRRGLGLLEG